MQSEQELCLEFSFSKKMQNGDGEPNNFFESFSEIDLGSDISGDLSGQEWWIKDNVNVRQQWIDSWSLDRKFEKIATE